MIDTQREQKITTALTHLQQGDMATCATLCDELVQADPSDAEAWSFLGLARIHSDRTAGEAALRQATELEPTEPRWHIHLGGTLLQIGEPAKAEEPLKVAVNLSGGHPETLVPWGDSLLATGRAAEAVRAFTHAAQKLPDPAILKRLARAKYVASDFAGAVETLEQAFAGQEMTPADKHQLAELHIRIGRYERAQEFLDELLPLANQYPEFAITSSNLARYQGDLDQAVSILSSSIDQNENHAGLLATLLEYKLDDPTKYRARAEAIAADESRPSGDRRALSFVLARYADKSGAYDTAWQLAKQANALFDDELENDTSVYRGVLENALNLYKASAPRIHENAPELIYIIGPPRSGGSLLQTVLAASPEVASVGEWGALMHWIVPMMRDGQDSALAQFTAQVDDLQKADIAGMRRRDAMARIFTDKAPHQAHIAGMLQRVHPSARFVDSRREARDIALSILFHEFAPTFAYSRRIEDIADYLHFHREAVIKWEEAGIPLTVHDHESFVRNPAEQGNTLFTNLGLSWRDEYLSPEQRQSTVRTFSAAQVRGEVSTKHSGKWKNYEQFMGETADRLNELNA